MQLTMLRDVVTKLQAWLEDHEGLSSIPIASFVWEGEYGQSIKIGPHVVWTDREAGNENLTFEYCRDEFLKELSQMSPFLEGKFYCSCNKCSHGTVCVPELLCEQPGCEGTMEPEQT